MALTATTKRLPLSQIVETPEFQILPAAQKMFVRAYFTSLETTGVADARSAVRIAYPATAPQNVASRACHVLNHKKIKAVLAIAFNRPVLASILPGLDEELKKAIAADLKAGGLSVSTQRAIVWYEKQVKQARAKEEEDAPPRYAVGELVEQNGKTFRIEAVEVEEVQS